MKTITTLGALFIVGMSFAQNTFGDIIGTFKSADKKENLFGALVYTSRGEEVFRTLTDEDGRFRISAVPPGEYTVYFVYEGDTVVAPKSRSCARRFWRLGNSDQHCNKNNRWWCNYCSHIITWKRCCP